MNTPMGRQQVFGLDGAENFQSRYLGCEISLKNNL